MRCMTLTVVVAWSLAWQPTGVAQQVFELAGQVERIDRSGRLVTITTASGIGQAPISSGQICLCSINCNAAISSSCATSMRTSWRSLPGPDGPHREHDRSGQGSCEASGRRRAPANPAGGDDRCDRFSDPVSDVSRHRQPSCVSRRSASTVAAGAESGSCRDDHTHPGSCRQRGEAIALRILSSPA